MNVKAAPEYFVSSWIFIYADIVIHMPWRRHLNIDEFLVGVSRIKTLPTISGRRLVGGLSAL